MLMYMGLLHFLGHRLWSRHYCINMCCGILLLEFPVYFWYQYARFEHDGDVVYVIL